MVSKKPYDRAKQARSIGALGGKKTLEVHGREHFRKLAKKRHRKAKDA